MTDCREAQSLYVLSDDNQPAISDLRANSGYLTCLMDIVQSDQKPHGKEKEPADPRSLMLRVLAAGIYSSNIHFVCFIIFCRHLAESILFTPSEWPVQRH